jgi:5-methylcytosine-specific restriction endonuclease McrA
MGTIGLHIPEWSGRARSEALAYVKALGRRRRSPCYICGQRIDYDLVYPHPDSCSVQHVKSRHLFPHLTWDRSNWEPAHLTCNKAAGTGATTTLGLTTL